MAKPKLALIPAAQGTKFYSVLPSDGTGDFTFTRGSVATRINAQGLIENVASGQSRLDYPLIDGVQKGCPHHILEPARTNLLTYSEQIQNTSNWNQLGGDLVVTGNAVISPDGTLSAGAITLANSSNRYFVHSPTTQTSSSSYTFSVYMKSAIGNLSVGIGGVNGLPVVDKTVTTEWQRFTYTFTVAANSVEYFGIDQRGLGKSTSGTLYFWGAQLEQGSYPTSYIPTNGNAAGVTRSAETATGAGNSTTFNDSEGVFMVECSTIADSGVVNEAYCISINDGGVTGSGNRVELLWFSDGKFYTQVGNSGQEFISSDTFNNKILIKYGSGSYDLYVNGFRRITDTFTSMSGLDSLDFKRQGSYTFYGNTKQLQYFDSALADTQLEQLTSWQSFRDMANGQLYTIE